MKKIKTITICSSAAFYKEVVEIEKKLRKMGFRVLIPKTAGIMKRTGDYSVSKVKTWYTNAADYKKKTALMNGHFKKVMKGDAILVVNNEKNGIPGYIGGNGLMEMTLAYYFKKPIFILRPVTDQLSIKEEVIGVNAIFLNEDLSTLQQYLKK